MGRLDGKRALVTGAASGIGEATARKYVAEGARVILADMSGAQEQLAAELGDATVPYSIDVADEAAVEAMGQFALDTFGGLDVLANNAGINGANVRVDEYPMDSFDKVMSVNLRGMFMVTRMGLRLMLKGGGGSIVHTASIGSFLATPTASAYCMSKGAILMLTKTAALEYAKDNIRVNAVAPGIVHTPWIDRLDQSMVDFLIGQIPQGRMCEPEEVANVSAFLASDEAGHVSGQAILIDGARTAG